MQNYPKKRSSLYTAQMGLRIEPELKADIKMLKDSIDEDVVEAIRIKIRELIAEFKVQAMAKAG